MCVCGVCGGNVSNPQRGRGAEAGGAPRRTREMATVTGGQPTLGRAHPANHTYTARTETHQHADGGCGERAGRSGRGRRGGCVWWACVWWRCLPWAETVVRPSRRRKFRLFGLGRYGCHGVAASIYTYDETGAAGPHRMGEPEVPRKPCEKVVLLVGLGNPVAEIVDCESIVGNRSPAPSLQPAETTSRSNEGGGQSRYRKRNSAKWRKRYV